jgi:UDP-4-amino-4-deoxy-L-arabinose formyltransferase / UDP-glucuronic acid dehydrogenase (UDP-4-keto-hexauronic acid decarboxylating)
MKSILFAYHDVGCEAIRTLHEMGEEILAVFTHEDDLKENVWFGSVKKLAKDLKIPVFCPEDPNSSEWIKKIKEMKPEIIFSFYYRKMICDEILSIPSKGALNFHGSLLPKYRGRAPVNWVLVYGEKETGVTLHYMVKKPDAGDIVAQKKISIAEEDTALTLYKKLIPLTRQIMLETIPLLTKGTAPRIPQDHSKATYFGGRKPEDGKINWSKYSREIYNLVRAVTHPYPGAFTFLNGQKVYVWWGKSSNEKENGTPGTIGSTQPLTISCGKGLFKIDKIQVEGQEEMDGTRWAKEHSIQAGMIFDRKN